MSKPDPRDPRPNQVWQLDSGEYVLVVRSKSKTHSGFDIGYVWMDMHSMNAGARASFLVNGLPETATYIGTLDIQKWDKLLAMGVK